MHDKTIAVIVFDRISPFHLSVPCAVFGEDRRDAGVPLFDFLVCRAEKKALKTNIGFGLTGFHDLDALPRAGTIIVPSWRDPNELPPKALLMALREAETRGATIVGLCLGSYVLAAAGLLNGRRATTHWFWAEDLAWRYPQILVDPDVLYVDEGEIVTSAGGAAGLDCCLHLLRRSQGAEIANRVARRLVVPPHRQGGQAQYIETPLRATTTIDRFAKMIEWLETCLDQPHTIDSLAERSCMGRRTLTRRFRQETGTTIGEWLLSRRLALAQRMLETTTKSIDLIAQESGFGSAVSLRLHFKKALRTSPARYRKEFRVGPG